MKKKTPCSEVVLAHPARQHSFYLAAALEKQGFPYKYITTVYLKEGNLTEFVLRNFLKGQNRKRAQTRRLDDIPDGKVLQFYESLGLVLLLLQRIPSLQWLFEKFNKFVNKKFSKRLARYVKKNGVKNVILFDQYAKEFIFELARLRYEANLILDMSAPVYSYMCVQYKKLLGDSYKENIEKRSIAGNYEVVNSSAFLAASNFTVSSLLASGVELENIAICRYGIDKDMISLKGKTFGPKVSSIFIGRLNRKKGFDQFLTLSKNYSDRSFFTALGDIKTCDFVESGRLDSCVLKGHVTKEQVYSYLDDSDILVMPSRADGFGFVVLEAMARGVAVICSDNTGASDIITDGVNGFVYKSSDMEELEKKFCVLAGDAGLRDSIRKSAYQTVARFDWPTYYFEVSRALNKFLL